MTHYKYSALDFSESKLNFPLKDTYTSLIEYTMINNTNKYVHKQLCPADKEEQLVLPALGKEWKRRAVSDADHDQS